MTPEEMKRLIREPVEVVVGRLYDELDIISIEFDISDDVDDEERKMRQAAFDVMVPVLTPLLAAVRERDRLREALEDFAEQDCTYPHQPCLSVHPSRLGHGVCDGCKARMALQESIGAKEEHPR